MHHASRCIIAVKDRFGLVRRHNALWLKKRLP